MLTSLKTFIANQADKRKNMRNYNKIVNISDPRVREEVLSMMGR